MAKKVKGLCLGQAKRIWVTIGLALALILSYFLFSQGTLFIEKMLFQALSFSMARPFNIVLYMFVHMSVWHLAVNVLTLLFFAAILELTLSGRDVAGCFLFSGALTVGLFSIFNPGISLIGASAGVWGIMAGAFVLDVRKTLVGFVIIALVLLLVFPAAEFVVKAEEHALENRENALETEFNTAVIEGKISEAERIAEEREKVMIKATKFGESREFAAKAKVDPFIHAYAAFFGIVYLLLFRKKETMNAIKRQNVLGFLKKRNR